MWWVCPEQYSGGQGCQLNAWPLLCPPPFLPALCCLLPGAALRQPQGCLYAHSSVQTSLEITAERMPCMELQLEHTASCPTWVQQSRTVRLHGVFRESHGQVLDGLEWIEPSFDHTCSCACPLGLLPKITALSGP